MSRPIYFEIPADTPDRALAFYQAVFGWQFNKNPGEQPYWVINTGTGEGIDGGLGLREPNFKAPAVVIGVTSLDQATERVVASGGSVVYPKHLIPGTGWSAYAQDTEGNLFGMIEFLPQTT